jgi:hypothetical protein
VKPNFLRISIAFAFGMICSAVEPQANDVGKKMEQAACTPCHSTRLIDSQRLSAAAWTKEIDKMLGWGAIVPNKQVLIDYLASQYSDSKPVPNPESSGNGVDTKKP